MWTASALLAICPQIVFLIVYGRLSPVFFYVFTIIMLIINDILIDEDIFLQNFVCDLRVCKGRCCIEGDLGAPLESKELDFLEKYYPYQEYRYYPAIDCYELLPTLKEEYRGDAIVPTLDPLIVKPSANCLTVSASIFT